MNAFPSLLDLGSKGNAQAPHGFCSSQSEAPRQAALCFFICLWLGGRCRKPHINFGEVQSQKFWIEGFHLYIAGRVFCTKLQKFKPLDWFTLHSVDISPPFLTMLDFSGYFLYTDMLNLIPWLLSTWSHTKAKHHSGFSNWFPSLWTDHCSKAQIHTIIRNVYN